MLQQFARQARVAQAVRTELWMVAVLAVERLGARWVLPEALVRQHDEQAAPVARLLELPVKLLDCGWAT